VRTAVPIEQRRYVTLDHWRGVACLLVLVNHTVWFRSGTWVEEQLYDLVERFWLGVPVFFVISGYCISAAADAHRHRLTQPLRTFFLRRVRRIFPPYWIVLFASVVVVGALDLALPGAPLSQAGMPRPWWFSPSQWLGNVTLSETWRYHVLPAPKGLFLGHAWTLCYEEQFYLLSGILLWAMPRRFFTGAAALTAGVALVAWKGPGYGWPVEGFFFDGGWLQFWLGVALYYAIVWAGKPVWWLTLAMFLGVALACVWDLSSLLDPRPNAAQAMFVASGFAALALVLRPWDRTLARLTILRPLQTCGIMCYSLYLVHLPVAHVLRALLLSAGVEPTPIASILVGAPPCLWVAWWFHRHVERRFMNPSLSGTAAAGSVGARSGRPPAEPEGIHAARRRFDGVPGDAVSKDRA
jgi:peptidoglycan/LPS O-acetylase OafA/YrhL